MIKVNIKNSSGIDKGQKKCYTIIEGQKMIYKIPELKSENIQDLKEIAKFLNFCFRRLQDKTYYLNGLKISDCKKGFILQLLNGAIR